MQGTKQIEREVVIHAPVQLVWGVLADATLLPKWVPAVQEVGACSLQGEGVGTVRSCDAELSGRSGVMVERCVEFTPMSRVAYVVEEETFGMRNMFDHYGFAINVAAVDPSRTRVTLETHYTPRNWMYTLMKEEDPGFRTTP
jgi:uncharacterized protein YndB with AHSA1/START domain